VRVVVAGLGRGQVASAPDRGRVTVALGTLKTTVPIADVRLDAAPTPAAPTRSERRVEQAVERRRAEPAQGPLPGATPQSVDAGLAPARTPDATCDLRGVRVAERLAELDRFLDDAPLAAREVVFVIHGHGTGAMKAAVREHLAGHAAVDKTRAGTGREGGDGITVVWLDV
jgi:DNA mismatch repair protein MutS2